MPAVERGRLGEAGDGVLGGGIGRRVRPRRGRRDRAVVDDAAALRVLRLEHAEGVLGAEERGGEVDVDDGLPLLEGDVLHRDARAPSAGIVEEDVEAAEGRLDRVEEPPRRRRACRRRRAPPAPSRRAPRPPRATASSGSRRRPARATAKPALARPSAAARPTPLPAPVISATLSAIGFPPSDCVRGGFHIRSDGGGQCGAAHRRPDRRLARRVGRRRDRLVGVAERRGPLLAEIVEIGLASSIR